MLTCLVRVLFTFYIQDVLKLKKNNSGAKGPPNHLVSISSVYRIIEFEDERRKTCWRGVGAYFSVVDGF